MFNRIPIDQLHQILSTPSSRISSNSSLIPLTPQISASSGVNFLSFDPLVFPHHHEPSFSAHDDQGRHEPDMISDLDMRTRGCDVTDPWSNDEVVQLLRIKSSSENWFQDLTWDQVSRKLAEIGYKRSAQTCKEKFEEETCRSFGSVMMYNKNNSRYLISDELDHVTVDFDLSSSSDRVKVNRPCQEARRESNDGGGGGGGRGGEGEIMVQPTQGNVQVVKQETARKSTGKRKREHKINKFKTIKGLCVGLVNEMMARQEETHRKLLEAMDRRDDEKIASEASRRDEESERVKREFHVREQEQAKARERQSTINELLNKLSFVDQRIQLCLDINFEELLSTITSEIPKMPLSDKATEDPNLANDDDTRRRWPRDEVLALINMRCNVCKGVDGHNDYENEGYTGHFKGGGSLWERVSEGLYELGYKRSAKRCKEKWENINKYFRKTKDSNKKRSLSSRTCPYYHQLSTLYNRGKPVSSSSTSQNPSEKASEAERMI